MTFPSIFLALLIGALIVLVVLTVQRALVRGTKMTSLTLLSRLSTMGLYMVFAAIATSLLSVLLSSPAAFADGMFRIFTGAPLIWTFTRSHLLLAFVIAVFGTAAIGFYMVRGRAANSRPLRRFLRGMPPSSGVRSSAPAQYPASPPSTGPADPLD
jgi:hypothetical protein